MASAKTALPEAQQLLRDRCFQPTGQGQAFSREALERSVVGSPRTSGDRPKVRREPGVGEVMTGC